MSANRSRDRDRGFDDSPVVAGELAPLRPWLDRRGQDVIEISVNEPGQVWVEHAGDNGYSVHRVPAISLEWARTLCHWLANYNGLGFHADLEVLSCRMPGGHRFHAVLGRQNVASSIAITIRLRRDIECDSRAFGWAPGRSFAAPATSATAAAVEPPGTLEWLLELVAAGVPVLISGGTSSGKTTFTNNIVLPAIPESRRVITIEDTHELYPPHRNRVQLLVNRVDSGHNRVTWGHMIDSVTRLNGDTVIVGELAVENAYPLLRLLNTGHSSFVTTVHANDPLEALEAFRRNIELAGRNAAGAISFLARTLGAVVQLVHDGHHRKIATIAPIADLPWRDLIDETGTAAALTRLAGREAAA